MKPNKRDIKSELLLSFLKGAFLLCVLCIQITDVIAQPQETPYIGQINEVSESIAGDSIRLIFHSDASVVPLLMITNSFGFTVVEAETDSILIYFDIPEEFTKYTGLLTWELVSGNMSYFDGNILILPQPTEYPVLENYFGPKTITAGGVDFAMMVVVATDSLDNPMIDGEEIILKTQILNVEKHQTELTDDFVAWRNFYSTDLVGKIFISAHLYRTTSKELLTNVLPSITQKFSISTSRIHKYADGNQMFEIRTDVLVDRYGNTVTDGTMVNFFIDTQSGDKLFTSGTTLDGVAIGRLLHPAHPDIWTVIAEVEGSEQSNSMSVEFEQATFDFALDHDISEGVINIGPIRGYMKQLIPDAILVECKITNDEGQTLYHEFVGTDEGYALFDINTTNIVGTNCIATVKLMGITKTLKLLPDKPKDDSTKVKSDDI